MNQTRSFLLIAWLVVATLLWMEWSKSQLAPPAAPTTPAAATPASGGAAPAAAPVPGLAPAGTGANATGPGGTALAPAATPAQTATSRPITIENDTLRLTVDLQGGRIIDSQLLHYTLEKKPGSPNVRLLSTEPALVRSRPLRLNHSATALRLHRRCGSPAASGGPASMACTSW